MEKLLNKFLNKPLKYKLNLMVMFITSTSVILACTAFIKYDIESTKKAMADELALVGEIIGKRTAPGMQFAGNENKKKAEENLYDLKSKKSIALACIYKKDGSILADYSPGNYFKCPANPPEIGHYITEKYLSVNQKISSISGKEVGSIYIKANMKKIDKHVAQIIVRTFMLMSAILFIAFMLTQKIQKIISTPVKNLTDTAQSIIRNNDYSARAKVLYKDEIGILAENFNDMVSKVQDRDNTLKNVNESLEEKVTERTKELEHALKAKSNFLSNMSHEIRTPNHAVMNCSVFVEADLKEIIKKLQKHNSKQDYKELIKNILDLAEGGLKSATRIRDASERQGRLLNDILDLSKLGEGKMETDMQLNDLKDVVSRVIAENEGLYKKGVKDLKVTLTKPKIDTQAIFDKDRITQVVSNLLGNAIKYSQKGKITMSIALSELENDGKKSPGLLFSISDEGVGIPKNELETIFDKFTEGSHTKKQSGGTGIGLAICSEIMKLHSGKIWAENNKNKGAVFTFVIPLKQPVQMEES